MNQKEILIASQIIIANDKDEKLENLGRQLSNTENSISALEGALVKSESQKNEAQEKWEKSFSKIQELKTTIAKQDVEIKNYKIARDDLKRMIEKAKVSKFKLLLQAQLKAWGFND